MAADDIRIPREHDRVTVEGHNGVLTVVSVDTDAKKVDLQFVTGDGPLVQGIAWSALRYMDEDTEEQSGEKKLGG